jgi:uncharacterized protein YfaS (alpha-2-macroglobulin family)
MALDIISGGPQRGSLLPGNVVAGLPVMALNVNNVDILTPW